MLASPNEGLKPTTHTTTRILHKVGMLASPNEGLKQYQDSWGKWGTLGSECSQARMRD